ITMVLQKQQNARLRAELAVVREENNRLSSAKQSRGLDRAAAQDLSASRSEARGKGTTADRKPSLDEIEAKVREAGSKAVWMPSSEWRRFVRRRSAKLTHLCSAKLTHRFRAGNAASSFQVAECFAFRGSGWRRACGVRDYARALSKSFQSCSEGRRRLTVGCRAIIARAMSSPT